MNNRFWLAIVVLFVSSLAFGQKNKDFEKIIKRYDMASVLQVKDAYPENFWTQLKQGHQGLQDFEKALSKKQKSAIRAVGDVDKALGLVDRQYQYLYLLTGDTVSNFTHSLQSELLGADSSQIHIHIVLGNEPNAFCTPRGDVYIYTSLLERIHYNIDLLYGICAHEAAHYFLRHSALQKWADRKREIRNNVLAGIAIGLNAVADGLAAYTAGYDGTKYESHIEETCQSILASAKNDNEWYHFKYSRMQELEADIVAVRFLEYIGIDPFAYMVALTYLKDEGEEFYSDWDDHPTIAYRTKFLAYLAKNYPLMR